MRWLRRRGILRIALFAFFLGLVAFDLKTLRRHERGVRELVSVYGLGSMIAFVSSLVALGTVTIGPTFTLLKALLAFLTGTGAD